ncbi:hypothetical protein ACJX0J_034680, partial [Zea mays]
SNRDIKTGRTAYTKIPRVAHISASNPPFARELHIFCILFSSCHRGNEDLLKKYDKNLRYKNVLNYYTPHRHTSLLTFISHQIYRIDDKIPHNFTCNLQTCLTTMFLKINFFYNTKHVCQFDWKKEDIIWPIVQSNFRISIQIEDVRLQDSLPQLHIINFLFQNVSPEILRLSSSELKGLFSTKKKEPIIGK